MGNGWYLQEMRETFNVGLWEPIIEEWEEFRIRTFILVRNRTRTKGWLGSWIQGSLFKEPVPPVYSIISTKMLE